MSHFAKFTKLHAALSDYKNQLQIEGQKEGHPMVRAMYLHYWEDKTTRHMNEQFMLGEDIIVAPVLDAGVNKVSAFLPRDDKRGSVYVHIWSHKEYDASKESITVNVDAPMGQPGVFCRKGSAVCKLL